MDFVRTSLRLLLSAPCKLELAPISKLGNCHTATFASKENQPHCVGFWLLGTLQIETGTVEIILLPGFHHYVTGCRVAG
jgi:hypothetical protein